MRYIGTLIALLMVAMIAGGFIIDATRATFVA